MGDFDDGLAELNPAFGSTAGRFWLYAEYEAEYPLPRKDTRILALAGLDSVSRGKDETGFMQVLDFVFNDYAEATKAARRIRTGCFRVRANVWPETEC